jgi:virginiamycin B lyase
VCLLALAGAILFGTSLASASLTTTSKPAFKTYLRATHGIVSQITRGPDGRMWFTEDFANQIGAITDAGVATHYPTGVKPGQPNSITLKPDKRLWYTLYGSAGKVGRMTARGAHTAFDTGAVVNSLVGSGVGGGKSLWIGGEFSQLWQLNTGGGIVKHIVPPALTASRIPSNFVAGKDGRTWVNLDIFIAAVDSSGKVVEFKSGYSPSPNIRDMVLGPDGNIWFVDSENLKVTGAIGRITPGGNVTLFRKGLQKSSAPLGITVGPDRNLWFTENAGGPHVGRITTAGKITLYKIPLPGSYSATDIARGLGRHLWVSSSGLAGLVRVTVP